MRRITGFVWILLMCLAVSGCQTYASRDDMIGIYTGMDRSRLERKMGPPDGRRNYEDGRYALKYYITNPDGVATAHYFIFDKRDRLTEWMEDKKDDKVDKLDVFWFLMSPEM